MFFDASGIIRSYRLAELQATKKPLCVFLGSLGSHHGAADHIGPGVTDQRILALWEKQLRKHKGMPYAVTEKDGHYKLIKIDNTLNEAEVKKERKNLDVSWFCEAGKL